MQSIHTPNSPNLSIYLIDKTLPHPLTMPCSLLLWPLGGLTGKTRRRYSLLQKIMFVEESNRIHVEQNFSIH